MKAFLLHSILLAAAVSASAGLADLDNPGPSVSAISMRQRYPWNGLVDIDVSFTGNVGETYRIELSATDKAGGTNLPVRTAWLEGGESAVGNPVDVPAPGTHRLVWNAGADLPAGFVADRVTVTAKLLNPIWSFESIPAINPNDAWAPETVYHDVQTVAAYGEIENHAPTVRCLTDEWNLESSLGANVVFSGSSMGLRQASHADPDNYCPISLWTWSDTTNNYRMVTLDYATGEIVHDNVCPYYNPSSDIRFFQMRDGDGRQFASMCRPGYDSFFKSANTDIGYVHIQCRYGDSEHGSAVCGYFPNGIPVSSSSATSVSSYDKGANAAVFFSGTAGTDLKEAIVLCGSSAEVRETSKYSCMKNVTGRYIVPMLDGSTYFTVGHGIGDVNTVQTHRVFMGAFSQFGGELFDLHPTGLAADWTRDPEVAYSKAAAMPDGVRFFFGGVGRDSDATIKMWCGNIDQYTGEGLQDDPDSVGAGMMKRVYAKYPSGHPFEFWARRDVTCLLPNGKFCGVDEELGLVVVNPLTGETYVASDNPAFKKGKMGCQLLPNGKVWIIPYDCEGREFAAGTNLCGKLYEVDFGFTRSFSLSSLCSPYLKVSEGDPEPSGIKVGLDPNGGELPGIYAQYYKGANPVYGALPVPTRSGYVFLGWSTDGTAATVVSPADVVPASGIKLLAAWDLLSAQNAPYMVVDLSGGSSAGSYPVSYLASVPDGGWSDEYKTAKLVLRRIEPGTFAMGSPSDELGRQTNEDLHQVTLTKPFYLGVFEITQKQWSLVAGSNPSSFAGDARPVECVSYNAIRGSSDGAGWPAAGAVDAESFLGKLRARVAGFAWDLPTEAQWEYACRAGTTTALNSGKNLETLGQEDPNMSEVGRYCYNGSDHAVVGSYAPNAWGLYDMHGNVMEWCLDWWQNRLGEAAASDPVGASSGSHRAIRGGGWYFQARYCRSAYRVYSNIPSYVHDYLGFRLSCEAVQ